LSVDALSMLSSRQCQHPTKNSTGLSPTWEKPSGNGDKEKNISQEALAEIADFDRTYISLLERGARNPAGMVVASVCPNASGVNAVSVES